MAKQAKASHYIPGSPPVDSSADAWETIYQANDAGWDMGQASPPLASFLEEGILPSKRRKVLVVGCGNGHELPLLAHAGYHTTGADFAPTAVKNTNKLIKKLKLVNARVVRADLLEKHEDLVDHSFGWIFDQTFFCALIPEQREQYAQSMKRLLKKDGELWVLNMRTPNKTRQPFDCTPNRFIKIMENAGFTLMEKRTLKQESHPRRRGRETLIRMTMS